ncbi:MAG: hypothetical protein WCK03_04410 [Candidatus Taylorbacteria bacterium]
MLTKNNKKAPSNFEGASFFFLENHKTPNSCAELIGLSTFLKPESQDDIRLQLRKFLETHQLSEKDIDFVILGLNGDPRTDHIYHKFIETGFPNTAIGYFKHLCGEYHTASAFATWLAAMILKTQTVPGVTRFKLVPGRLERILIYNHFQGNNHSFILLTRP